MNQCPMLALRSVDLYLPNIESAESFYTQVWKLSVVARHNGSVFLRGAGADHHLLALHTGTAPAVRMVTFRAASIEALDGVVERAPQHGGVVLSARKPETEPGGGQSVVVRDPQGRILRCVYGDERLPSLEGDADSPQRLAHVVMNSHDVAAGLPFYENVLGMRLSDRTRIMAFVRIPQQGLGDHHSVALADADNDCLNHIAFVMPNLDAVMRGGGRMKDAGHGIEWGPGRHGPGNNAFNYFIGPEGFVIEYTAEVEQVDDNYRVGTPEDWKWPPGRVDQWGISQAPSQALKHAQRQIGFSKELS